MEPIAGVRMWVLLLLMGCCALSVQQVLGAPHVILVVLDSVGKGDLLAAEDKMGYSTPGFKKLVSQGAVLRNFYVQPETSPSKASILTGKYPFRLGLQEQLVAGTTAHLPMNVPTLAELLKSAANYETHYVGGWGLGYASVYYTPTKRGFDTFYGFLGPDVDYVNKTKFKGFDFWDERASDANSYSKPAFSAKGNYSTRQYRTRVNQILGDYVARKNTPEAQSETPLYLMISHQAGRGSLDGHPNQSARCKKSSKARKRYCAMMMELDDAMMELYSKLNSLNLWSNSLIIVTSLSGSMVPLLGFHDNGNPVLPGSVGSNYPFRGARSTLFEGGVRGIAFVSGGRLPKEVYGKSYDGLAHAVDVPVFILSFIINEENRRLTNGGWHQLRRAIINMDGSNIPIFGSDYRALRRSPLKAPRTEVPVNIVSHGFEYSAIRFGRWKLITGIPQQYRTGDGWWPANAEGPPQLPKPERHGLLFVYKLFDLIADPNEKLNKVNLTEIIRDGRSKIKGYVNSGDYREPQNNVFSIWALPLFHGGAWAPFLDKRGAAFVSNDLELS